jgi:hypothetical protein
MNLVATLVDVVRVLWTLAHGASVDAIDPVTGLILSNISACGRAKNGQTVTIKVQVEPIGASPRREVDGVVPPPVDRTDVAEGGGRWTLLPPTLMAST